LTDKDIYRIWAPAGKKWVDWVRPVPFVGINKIFRVCSTPDSGLPVITFLDDKDWKVEANDFALILDLAGEEGVKYGIALAKYGFRPIPIYNGTMEQVGSRATVDNGIVGMALKNWAQELEKIEINDDARPAFLLDSNRLNRYKMKESIFDNSWDVYPQDLPSAQYFLDSGIKRILVVGRKKISEDLRKILASHHKKGMEIYLTDGYEEPKRVRLTGYKKITLFDWD